ncbi:unnamed protein product [Chrysoparadoxa australica]
MAFNEERGRKVLDWMVGLNIPEKDAARYAETLLNLGFDDVPALAEDLEAEDLRNADVRPGHARRMLRALGSEGRDRGGTGVNKAGGVQEIRCRRCRVVCVDEEGRESSFYLEPQGVVQASPVPQGQSFTSPPPQLEQMPNHDVSSSWLSVLTLKEGRENGGAGDLLDHEADSMDNLLGSASRGFTGEMSASADPLTWDVEAVLQWLQGFEALRAQKYAKAFSDMRIDGRSLLGITSEADAEDVGIMFRPHRLRLVKEIAALRALQQQRLSAAQLSTDFMSHTDASSTSSMPPASIDSASCDEEEIGTSGSAGAAKSVAQRRRMTDLMLNLPLGSEEEGSKSGENNNHKGVDQAEGMDLRQGHELELELQLEDGPDSNSIDEELGGFASQVEEELAYPSESSPLDGRRHRPGTTGGSKTPSKTRIVYEGALGRQGQGHVSSREGGSEGASAASNGGWSGTPVRTRRVSDSPLYKSMINGGRSRTGTGQMEKMANEVTPKANALHGYRRTRHSTGGLANHFLSVTTSGLTMAGSRSPTASSAASASPQLALGSAESGSSRSKGQSRGQQGQGRSGSYVGPSHVKTLQSIKVKGGGRGDNGSGRGREASGSGGRGQRQRRGHQGFFDGDLSSSGVSPSPKLETEDGDVNLGLGIDVGMPGGEGASMERSYEFSDGGTLKLGDFILKPQGMMRAPPYNDALGHGRRARGSSHHGGCDELSTAEEGMSYDESADVELEELHVEARYRPSSAVHSLSEESSPADRIGGSGPLSASPAASHSASEGHDGAAVHPLRIVPAVHSSPRHGNGHSKGQGSDLLSRPNSSREHTPPPLRTRESTIVMEELGRGAGGTVFKAIHVQSLRLVAVKTVAVHEDDKRHQIVRELRALHAINLVPLRSPPSDKGVEGPTSYSPAAGPEGDGDAVAEGYAGSDADVEPDVDAGSESSIEEDMRQERERRLLLESPAGRERRQSGSAASIASAGGRGSSSKSSPVPRHQSSFGRDERERGSSAFKAQATPPRGRKLSCPYIVAFHDAYTDPDKGCVCMVMELMDAGTLQQFVQAKRALSERDLCAVSRCVLKALAEMHSQLKIHRDVKPSNILINRRGQVKISDFGVVRELNATASLASTFTGTLTYMSPERINNEAYSYPSDLWSLGLVVVTLALGRFPFATNGGYWAVVQAIQEGPLPLLTEDNFSPELCDFVASMLRRDPADRPSARKLLRHPFMAKYKGVKRVAGLVPPCSAEECEHEATSIMEQVVTHQAVSRIGRAGLESGQAGGGPRTPLALPSLSRTQLKHLSVQLGTSTDMLLDTHQAFVKAAEAKWLKEGPAADVRWGMELLNSSRRGGTPTHQRRPSSSATSPRAINAATPSKSRRQRKERERERERKHVNGRER